MFYFNLFFRLGFSSSTSSATSTNIVRECTYESVLVVCVVGGISYIEVAQVQSVINQFIAEHSSEHSQEHSSSSSSSSSSSYNQSVIEMKVEDICVGFTRVIILSNTTTSPEDVLKFII